MATLNYLFTSRSTLSVTFTAVVLMGVPFAAGASEFSGVVTLGSEYIYRGQAVSTHDPAMSLGLDYEHDSGFFAGLWASTIKLESPFGARDTELDYYVGFHHEPNGPLSLSASLIRYTYPGHTGRLDYEHTEAILAVIFLEQYSLEFAYSDDVYDLGGPGRHWALRGEWPAASYWIVSAGLGLSDLTAIGSDRYAYWDLGASTRWSSFTLDLRWHDNEDIERRFANWSAGSRMVLSVSYGF